MLVVPLFIVLAAVWKGQSKGMLISALILSVLGTGFAFLSVSTGEAAEKFAKAVPGAKPTLERHEGLAELARNLSIVLMLVLAAVTAAYVVMADRTSRRVRLIGGCVLFAMSLVPAIVLANAAHEGGKLVHVHGVHAPIVSGGAASVNKAIEQGASPEREDD